MLDFYAGQTLINSYEDTVHAQYPARLRRTIKLSSLMTKPQTNKTKQNKKPCEVTHENESQWKLS